MNTILDYTTCFLSTPEHNSYLFDCYIREGDEMITSYFDIYSEDSDKFIPCRIDFNLTTGHFRFINCNTDDIFYDTYLGISGDYEEDTYLGNIIKKTDTSFITINNNSMFPDENSTYTHLVDICGSLDLFILFHNVFVNDTFYNYVIYDFWSGNILDSNNVNILEYEE